ncbi:hypothetical protein [Kaistella pullorum]|uniref:Uncharacterized protein n=1 Tax=Kaistella pullorum TaxID=2763074 RepID=A0ABR8WQ51_9FLAO|nr:hypothetical protein [Kaistella pullorum]MBD8019149.1 hypothetical protein [Kaistella pullorum]
MKVNFLKTGFWIGMIPIFGVTFLFLLFYGSREVFALDINVDGIGFLFLLLSSLLVLTGIISTLISIFTQKQIKKSVFVLLIIFLSIPVILEITKLHANISSRGYIELVNESGINFQDVQIEEPDEHHFFSKLRNKKSQIIYFHPDYGTYNEKQLAGMNQNYLLLQTTYDNYLKIKIPTIHPGEIHKIIIDKNLNLTDYHINKIE